MGRQTEYTLFPAVQRLGLEFREKKYTEFDHINADY